MGMTSASARLFCLSHFSTLLSINFCHLHLKIFIFLFVLLPLHSTDGFMLLCMVPRCVALSIVHWIDR